MLETLSDTEPGEETDYYVCPFCGYTHAGPMTEKCPVCGMFVAKYPDWVAAIAFSDGLTVFFDGVKDMLKYYFNMGKYAPGKTTADIQAIHVTDYYRLEPINGRQAFYVVGSDVYWGGAWDELMSTDGDLWYSVASTAAF